MTHFIKARDLHIDWIEDPRYWGWLPISKANKAEIAILKEVWWFSIAAKVDTKILCKKVGYTVYLVYDFVDETPAHDSDAVRGLDTVKASVRSTNKIADRDEGYTIHLKEKQYCGNAKGVFPTKRASDGRLEVELGQFHTNYWGLDDGVLEIRVFNIEGHLKKGILIVGIELRPC